MSVLGYREVLALVLEELPSLKRGQLAELSQQVVRAARRKDLIAANEERRVEELVRHALWECLLRRLIVFGMNNANPNWPFYCVTEYGERALAESGAQPYDPDGFMQYFRDSVSTVDPVITAYLAEAVQAFNSGCLRSAAVMIGCASEKLILLLCEAFENSIADPARRAAFTRDLERRWLISHKYSALKNRLDLMVAAKKLPAAHLETVAGELPAGYELLRRCRNSAGHPDVPGDVRQETVFMNLRMFTEYARRVTLLIEYFVSTPAEW